MLLCRVDGNIVTTACHESIHCWRQAICQPLDEAGEPSGNPIVAIDPFGAGMHQQVIVSSDGRGVRERLGDPHTPLRYMIIGVVDDPAATKEAVA